jgi:hypothetical protein
MQEITTSYPSIHPFMVLQPLLGLDLPQQTPPFFSVFSILTFLGYVTCPSGRQPPIMIMVLPLVLYYDPV